MKKYTLSGIEHVIHLLQKHPQLISLPCFAGVREIAKMAQNAVRKSGCGCSAGPVYAANRSVFERSLEQMQHGNHLIVKNVLKVDQLCYYIKDNTGKRMLKCI